MINAWTGKPMELTPELEAAINDFQDRVMTVWRWYAQMGYRRTPRRAMKQNFPNLPPDQLQCPCCAHFHYYPAPPTPPGKKGLLCGHPTCDAHFKLIVKASQTPDDPDCASLLKAYQAFQDANLGRPDALAEGKRLVDVDVQLGESGSPRRWMCLHCHTTVYADQLDCVVCGADLTDTGGWSHEFFLCTPKTDVHVITDELTDRASQELLELEDQKFLESLQEPKP